MPIFKIVIFLVWALCHSNSGANVPGLDSLNTPKNSESRAQGQREQRLLAAQRITRSHQSYRRIHFLLPAVHVEGIRETLLAEAQSLESTLASESSSAAQSLKTWSRQLVSHLKSTEADIQSNLSSSLQTGQDGLMQYAKEYDLPLRDLRDPSPHALSRQDQYVLYWLLEELSLNSDLGGTAGFEARIHDILAILNVRTTEPALHEGIFNLSQRIIQNPRDAKPKLSELKALVRTAIEYRDAAPQWAPGPFVPDKPPMREVASRMQELKSRVQGRSASEERPSFLRRMLSGASGLLISQAHAAESPHPDSPGSPGSTPGEGPNEPLQVLIRFEGGEYRGGLLNDLPQGYGVYSTKNGGLYVGHWHEGRPAGEGEIHFPGILSYQGQFLDGRPHGKGQFTGPAGYRIEGEFQNGKLQGKASVAFPGGEAIHGSFQEGALFGKAAIVSRQGPDLVAHFEDDVPMGPASVYLKEGIAIDTLFEGDFSFQNQTFVYDSSGAFATLSSTEVAGLGSDEASTPLSTAASDFKRAAATVSSSFSTSTSGTENSTLTFEVSDFRCTWHGPQKESGPIRQRAHGVGRMQCEEDSRQGILSSTWQGEVQNGEPMGYGTFTQSYGNTKEAFGYANGGRYPPSVPNRLNGEGGIRFRDGLSFDGLLKNFAVRTRHYPSFPHTPHFSFRGSGASFAWEGTWRGSESAPACQNECYFGEVQKSTASGMGQYIKDAGSADERREECTFRPFYLQGTNYATPVRFGNCNITDHGEDFTYSGELYGTVYQFDDQGQIQGRITHIPAQGQKQNLQTGEIIEKGWFYDGPRFISEEKPEKMQRLEGQMGLSNADLEEIPITDELLSLFSEITYFEWASIALELTPFQKLATLVDVYEHYHLVSGFYQDIRNENLKSARNRLVSYLAAIAAGRATSKILAKLYRKLGPILKKSGQKIIDHPRKLLGSNRGSNVDDSFNPPDTNTVDGKIKTVEQQGGVPSTESRKVGVLKKSPDKAPSLRKESDRLLFRGEPNSVIQGTDVARNGGGKRVFVTDESGRIVKEITPQRVKVRRRFEDPSGNLRESFRKTGKPNQTELNLLELF